MTTFKNFEIKDIDGKSINMPLFKSLINSHNDGSTKADWMKSIDIEILKKFMCRHEDLKGEHRQDLVATNIYLKAFSLKCLEMELEIEELLQETHELHFSLAIERLSRINLYSVEYVLTSDNDWEIETIKHGLPNKKMPNFEEYYKKAGKLNKYETNLLYKTVMMLVKFNKEEDI